jgi:hypothetical protein
VGVVVASEMRSGAEAALGRGGGARGGSDDALGDVWGGDDPCGGSGVCGRDGRPDGGDATTAGTGGTAVAAVLRERKKQRDEPVRGAPRGFINI